MGEFKQRKKAKLTTSADVLQSLLQNSKSPLSDQFLRWKLWRKWPEVVGFSIAEQTAPVGYEKGVLYVWVKNATWLQQMTFVSPAMRDKINTFMGRKWTHRIHFTLDRHRVPELGKGSAVEDFLED